MTLCWSVETTFKWPRLWQMVYMILVWMVSFLIDQGTYKTGKWPWFWWWIPSNMPPVLFQFFIFFIFIDQSRKGCVPKHGNDLQRSKNWIFPTNILKSSTGFGQESRYMPFRQILYHMIWPSFKPQKLPLLNQNYHTYIVYIFSMPEYSEFWHLNVCVFNQIEVTQYQNFLVKFLIFKNSLPPLYQP